MNRDRALGCCLRMIFSENRFALSGSCFGRGIKPGGDRISAMPGLQATWVLR
jgi:hypothetical protein